MRLIDADTLRAEFTGNFHECRHCTGIWATIDVAPTIDAEPVRHGHWIIHVDELFPNESSQECSICHAEEWISLKHENYCPNCGARMDEVSE